jgi:hypothetical protein
MATMAATMENTPRTHLMPLMPYLRPPARSEAGIALCGRPIGTLLVVL